MGLCACVCARVSVRSVPQSCLTLYDPMDCNPPRLLWSWNFPGKNARVGYHSLLQGIFLTQGLNPHLLCLLHCRVGSLLLWHLGSPTNGISALTKEILESSFTLSGHVRIQREVGGLPNRGITPGLLHCRWILYHLSHQGNPQREKRIFTRTQSCWYPDLRLQASWTMREKFLLIINHSGYGILL